MKKMLFLPFIIFLFFIIFTPYLLAGEYDYILKGGHVIDPGNGINQVMDVAVSGNIIAKVDKNIGVEQTKKVIDVSGFYVTPGLIDIHAHVYYNSDGYRSYLS